MRKPRIFIGSSKESLDVAEAVHVNLDPYMEVSLWRVGTFSLSSQTIDELIKKSSWVDFGLFIFTPDDISLIRNKEEHVARDNVVFELGVFIGALGKERCFILKPRDSDLHLPSDLAGLTTADYDHNRTDNDLSSAVVSPCVLVRKEAEKLKVLRDEKASSMAKDRRKDLSITLMHSEIEVLKFLLKTETSGGGFRSWDISDHFRKRRQSLDTEMSLIKLCRTGLINKRVFTNDVGNEYIAFCISEEGIEFLLEEEKQYNIPF